MLTEMENGLRRHWRTCCFTGHRCLPEDHKKAICRMTLNTVELLIKAGVRYFITGGARGYDLMAAQAVLAKKKRLCPEVHLALYLPHREHTKYWNKADAAAFQKILAQADEVRYISETYYRGCELQRNREMVEQSRFCVFCCEPGRTTGGTAYTMRYAYKYGCRVLGTWA